MQGEIIVLVTSPSELSEKLACTLVEERLAACVNVITQMRSIYIWEGKVCNEPEHLLVVKSNRGVWEMLRDRVKQLHPYAVPEIIYFPLEGGDKAYMDWLNGAVAASR